LFQPRNAYSSSASVFTPIGDESWSFVDCISKVVMKEGRIIDALTTDHHFKPAWHSVAFGTSSIVSEGFAQLRATRVDATSQFQRLSPKS
jgi:hypothetical protein